MGSLEESIDCTANTRNPEDAVAFNSTTGGPTTGKKSVTFSLLEDMQGLEDGIETRHGKDSHAATRATITERTRNLAATWKQRAVAALTPKEGDRELAKTITGSLSNLPTRLRGKISLSRSSPSERPNADVLSPLINSDSSSKGSATAAPDSALGSTEASVAAAAAVGDSNQVVKDANIEPKSETSSSMTANTGTSAVTGEEKIVKVDTLNGTPNNGDLDSNAVQTPESPKTPMSASSAVVDKHPNEQVGTYASASSAGVVKHRNENAEAYAEAHRARVIAETNAFLEAEDCKAEAELQKLHAKLDQQRLQVETKAIEHYKKEELKADSLLRDAEAKAEKILAEAKSKAASIKNPAEEEYAKSMADARTKAEKSLAEVEETKQRELAELPDRVEGMILMGQFPAPPEHKGVVKRVKEKGEKVKEKVISTIRGY